MTSSRTVVLAGSNGLVGGACLRRLLAAPAVARVVALARRPLGVAHPKLVERSVDFEHLPPDLLAGGEDVLCALGTTIAKAGSQEAFRAVDYGYPLRLAESAAAAGARSFVLVSSVGANARSRNFYLRVKGEVEAAVGALPLPSVYVMRPGLLLGERAERRRGEAVGQAIMPALRPLLAGPLRKYRAIAADQVAGAMCAASDEAAPGRHVWENDQIEAHARG